MAAKTKPILIGCPQYSELVGGQYECDASPMTPGTHWMTSTNGGATWSSPNDTYDMQFYVYGTVTTKGDPQWP